MRAHLIQLDIRWESPQHNFDAVRSLLEHSQISPGDLIALPELFDVGFTLNTASCCDRDGTTLAFLAQLARDTGCLVHGSRAIMPASGPGSLAYNCATVLGPDAQEPLCEYHKIHPFSMGSEPRSYQGGDTITSYRWGADGSGLTVSPLICYDLRFPELFRKCVVEGAEMFVLGANWPAPRQFHWRSLLIARAIENQAFVLGINRCGNDPHLSYSGGTIAVNPKGKVLGELDDGEGVLSVEIDPSVLREWRSQFPVLNDIKIRSF